MTADECVKDSGSVGCGGTPSGGCKIGAKDFPRLAIGRLMLVWIDLNHEVALLKSVIKDKVVLECKTGPKAGKVFRNYGFAGFGVEIWPVSCLEELRVYVDKKRRTWT